MQFINFAIESVSIVSVAFFGSLFVSGLVNRYRPAAKTAIVADLPQPAFIPNPDGFAVATEEEAAIVDAHEAFVAQYWAKRPTNNVVLFVRPVATIINYDTMTPYQLRQECQRQGIKWRNARGSGKHMPTAEMRQRLRGVA